MNNAMSKLSTTTMSLSLTLFNPALPVACYAPADFVVSALAVRSTAEAVIGSMTNLWQLRRKACGSQCKNGVQVRIVHLCWDVCIPFRESLGVWTSTSGCYRPSPTRKTGLLTPLWEDRCLDHHTARWPAVSASPVMAGTRWSLTFGWPLNAGISSSKRCRRSV